MNKQYIDFNDIDVNEEIDFEFINEEGREDMSYSATAIATTPDANSSKSKTKYTRKTIYVSREYADVLEFFERKNSSVEICKLLRQTLQKEKGMDVDVDLTTIMQAINDLNNKLK